ncbi:MAG: hydroxymethylbilane synthase [Chthoniobacterales bacterium]|jgi:hydroxymethylbilane synthase
MKIVLGTRGSSLALAQAEIAGNLLSQVAGIEKVERQIIKTTGDRRLDLRLSDSGKKFARGLFTKELEECLLSGQIDVAVHSLKDLPTELPEGLAIAAVLPREDPADVLVSRQAASLSAIRVNGVIATSSPRRARQLQRLRPDLTIVDVRGNVPTRIDKLINQPSWDGLILARAGLERLGLKIRENRIQFDGRTLFASIVEGMLPAAGQGAIALEVLEKSSAIRDLLRAVNDPETWFCVHAEREFLRLLGGGCEVPIGVRATIRSAEGNDIGSTSEGGSSVNSESSMEEQALLEAVVFEEDIVHTGSVAGNFGSAERAAQILFRKIYGDRR